MTRHAFAFVSALLFAIPLPAQAVEWWQKDFDSALAAAKDKPSEMVLLYCWRADNDNCSAMFGGTLSDEKVAPALAEFLCMGAKDDDAGRPVLQRYGIGKVPTVLFLDPTGAVVDVIPGYVPVDRFLEELKRIRAGTDTIASLRQQVAAAPENLKLQLQLVQKLRAAGDKPGSLSVIDAMVQQDERLKSEEAAEAMLLKLTDETFAADITPADYDLGPLRRFLAQQRNKRVLFLGYDRMAAAEYRRGDLKAAAAAAQKAYKSIPDNEVIDWGQNIASLAYQHWQELEKLDKTILKRALTVSEDVLDLIAKEQQDRPDKSFYANAMYLHASVMLVNKKRKPALELMQEAMKIDPDNENLKKAYDRWLAGSK